MSAGRGSGGHGGRPRRRKAAATIVPLVIDTSRSAESPPHKTITSMSASQRH